MLFELEPVDISNLNDSDLREMVARLCEAELIRQKIQPSCVLWGGAQEAPDGGLDVRVSSAISLSQHGFIPRSNTGFQVKKNIMSRAACTKEMLDKGVIKPVIEDLASLKGAYVIVSGKDNCSDKMLSERLLGMKEAVKELKNNEDLCLDFYGSDRLAAWLRQFPGVALWVRSKLGKPLSGWKSFGRWAATPIDKDDGFLLDDHPCVIDLNAHKKDPINIADGIKLTRERLRANGSVVRITGLSGVGKTRFAQALFEPAVCEDALPATNVIYADLGDDLRPTASELITYLIANDHSIYVVLDNCPPDVHRKLQKQVSSNQAKLSLLTIEYDISDDRPEETDVIHIEPSSETTVSLLVQKRFPELGRVNADKISEFSGGNARVAIALASRVGSDETLANFSDEELFERLFNQRKGASSGLLESAEVLSLVYSFNVSQAEFNDELSVLANISGLDRRSLNRNHAELLRRQLSQKRGNWRAVLPHALANRLARRALQNISLNEINAELLKPENFRLFESCAHRISYLHEFEPARQLVQSWVEQGGPLSDITSCDSRMLKVIGYIAPVLPDAVLIAIERACVDPEFCTRDNENFLVFVRLLRQLAYDDKNFDRAVELMLKFAETEKSGEHNNSIVGILKSLFSLYLSGTLATPIQRIAFINRMLSSGKQRYFEIAQCVFQSAFETSNWMSFGTFDFGAHSRGYGWEPKTHEEVLGWYLGFIELLRTHLDSGDEYCKKWAKVLLANHFRGLWSFAGCFENLEKIVLEHASGGRWPEIWLSIKRVIYYDRDRHSSDAYKKLQSLERVAAPSDLYSEIESYVFINTWDHIELGEDNYSEKLKILESKIVKLGEMASSKIEYVEKFLIRPFCDSTQGIWWFGRGVANGAVDQLSLFEVIVQLIKNQNIKDIKLGFIGGFITGVHSLNPELARKLLIRCLDTQELKPYFVFLLQDISIDEWAIARLIELAKTGELEPKRFEYIKYGQLHKSISDSDLSILLSALNDLHDGIFSTIEILNMRFFIDNNSDYIPDDALRYVGRQAIRKLVSIHRNDIGNYPLHGVGRVIEECLSQPATKNEITEIIELLCDGIKSYRLSSHELEKIIEYLVKNYPELVLDRVFLDSEQSGQLIHYIFDDYSVYGKESSLNLASSDRIINWCGSDQNRIQKVAAAVSVYTSVGDTPPMENPKEVVLSDHIKSLLEIAEDKISIVETIYFQTLPSRYSGSRAELLEVRAKAFSGLLEYPSIEVREFAKVKLSLIERSVRECKDQEAEKNARREQRFE